MEYSYYGLDLQFPRRSFYIKGNQIYSQAYLYIKFAFTNKMGKVDYVS